MAKRYGMYGMKVSDIKIGQFDRDPYSSVMFIEDRNGKMWGVKATREGEWRVHTHPREYDDDGRVYASGNVHDTGEFSSSAEAFKAAKKTARKYLTDLLKSENLL